MIVFGPAGPRCDECDRTDAVRLVGGELECIRCDGEALVLPILRVGRPPLSPILDAIRRRRRPVGGP